MKKSAIKKQNNGTKQGNNNEKQIKKIINKQLNAAIEDKMNTAKFPATLFNSGIAATGDIIGILPAISTGTNENQRIGNDIRIKKLTVMMNVMTTSYTSTSAPGLYVPNARFGVRVMIVQPKTVMNRVDINANQGGWLSRLLRDGNSSVAFDGTLDNFYLPINTEVITKYYDKKFIFNTPQAWIPVGSTGAMSVPTNSTYKRLTINVIKNKGNQGKLVKYDQSYDTLYPTNYNPVVLIGYCKLDNSLPDTLDTNIRMNFTSVVTYQDA